MDTPTRKNASPRLDSEWVYTRRFWHWRAKRYIYAKPGQVFRLPRWK